ncbi:ATP-binding protein [Chitinilyticum piscinae]|uniref:Sensory/regulatory protein RpfC n=1 Tax=Chitinilyticum piscinae TaxID=2866724 RepID=A0A8J7FJF0_9NEIS|nr:ATP-binding protein [Chitinilyticum piscinae]MBE9610308.1 PAS domain-containing protein [Chitinilyticum piscinae]
MNRLLLRQLKRQLGWQDETAVAAALAALAEGRCPDGLTEGLPRLLQAIDEAYAQFERDVELRTRSLELSSAELTGANEALRQEGSARQRVLDALLDTANRLLADLGRPALGRDTADLERLSSLMGELLADRQRAERALAQREAQFRTLVDNIPGVVFRCQVDYPWGMEYINEEIQRLTGYTQEDFLLPLPRRSYGSLVLADDLPQVEAAIAQALQGSDRYEVEYRLRTADNQIRQVFERGQIVRDHAGAPQTLDGIIFDVTEQTRAANQLRMLSAALEASPSAVMITDVAGLIEYVNPKLEQATGYALPELLGRTPRVFQSGLEDPALFRQLWQQVLSGEEFHADLRNRTRDGEILWVSASVSPIRNRDGKITHLVAVYEDIGLRKAAEAELLRARDAADQANRLKSDFLANMSHEIRTPMNAILGMTHLALKTRLDAKQHDYLSKTRVAAESLLHILNDILDFSKIEANKLHMEQVPFRIGEVLEQLLAIHLNRAEEKGLALRVALADDCPPCLKGDPVRLGQVLSNLVSNAIKFTAQGEITVRIDCLARQNERVQLQVSVRDSGIGLSDEQIARLFRPFVQADGSTTRQFGGTGLGLSISRRLVEMMGGQIGVLSSPGQGSTFRFDCWLELAESVCELQAATARGEDIRLDGLRVLLVEDNPLNQLVARELLQGAGAQVLLAQHGGEALGWLSIDPLPCDVVLMDLQMPVLDGHETTRLLRAEERLAGLPIIAMTAHALSDERTRCLELGMNDYITKPIEPHVLFGTLQKWCDKAIIPERSGEMQSPTEEHREPVNEDALPQIADIRCDLVLQQLMNDRQLFESLFRQYLADYGDLAGQFAGLLASDPAGAERLAHSLKSVAGILGMQRFAELAAGLEQQLRNHPGIDGGLLQPFLDEHARLYAAVRQAYPERSLSTGEDGVLDERVPALLERLAQLLGECDGDAVDVFYALSELLEGHVPAAQLAPLGDAITNHFDFAAAAEHLTALQGWLKGRCA